MAAFADKLRDIRKLDASEGPSRNVLEPKFKARDQAMDLLNEVRVAHHEVPSSGTQRQAARLMLFLGVNHSETDEEAEGLRYVLRGCSLAVRGLHGRIVDRLDDIPEADIHDMLLRPPSVDGCEPTEAVLLMEALNTLGIILSNRPLPEALQDARRLLHNAEDVHAKLSELPLEPDVKTDADQQMTKCVFYLAQAYGAIGDARLSAKYVHLTMVRQMQTGVEYSPKDWATNAVHLAGFYAGDGHFGLALHCLEAARLIMPVAPADEETSGVVCWGFGKSWKAVLRSGAQREPTADSSLVTWWVDLPVEVPPPRVVTPPSTYEDARSAFRCAVLELEKAATFFTLDGSCPDHIAIIQDIAECFKFLAAFEPDVERVAAMHARRVALLKKFPSLLSEQAYLTLIRQLLYDLGEAATDHFDVRVKQYQSKVGDPLTPRQINHLGDVAGSYFSKFLSSVDLTKPVDKDLCVPVFRVMMRLAHLDSRRVPQDRNEERELVAACLRRYDAVVAFADANGLATYADLKDEVALAREMQTLLPGKLRQLA